MKDGDPPEPMAWQITPIETGLTYEDGSQANSVALEEIEHVETKARSRPDPQAPTLTAADLQAYEGAFEGWTSDLRVETSVRDGRLVLGIDGDDPVEVTAVAEKTFRSRGGELEVSFSGRAGTIEGLVIRRDGSQSEYLRRSVAEPIGAAQASRHPESHRA